MAWNRPEVNVERANTPMKQCRARYGLVAGLIVAVMGTLAFVFICCHEAVVFERVDPEVGRYQEAARMGDAEAMRNLGLCYRDGKGIGENDVEAVKWSRMAA